VTRYRKKQPVDADELASASALVEAIRSSLEQMRRACWTVAGPILEDIKDFLACDYNDSDLVTFVALNQGGAERLAAYCQESGDEKAKQLLAVLQDPDVLRQWLAFGGPKNGEYGKACEIYNTLVPPNDPVLKRLALAVALELAAPLYNSPMNANPIDPLLRYIHYEQAYLCGELDPAFPQFTVWELRHVVNCDAPDDQLGWGRECLVNYRPDLVLMDDPQWRYCYIIHTDVAYKHPEWYKEKRSYDQILSGGTWKEL
jgi:hypothetical protein